MGIERLIGFPFSTYIQTCQNREHSKSAPKLRGFNCCFDCTCIPLRELVLILFRPNDGRASLASLKIAVRHFAVELNKLAIEKAE
jgi:hypothetical protein